MICSTTNILARLARFASSNLTGLRFALMLLMAAPLASISQEASVEGVEGVPAPAVPSIEQVGSIYVAEYRVRGSKLLSPDEVGAAVYPYLGPYRTEGHIEEARAALEKAFHDKGYQTVFVSVPEQSGARGIIFLEVTETKVGVLRVKGAKYFLPSTIKRKAKSLAPGTVPDFEQVKKDIIKLNKSADMSVTPSLNPGAEPGTLDVDLTVEDHFPLHGSFELNNRYNANTVPLRLNGSLNYGNLWQLGHTIGGSFQVAPEEPKDATIFSAFYTIPVTDRWSLTASGTKQDSDVSTLGGVAVLGRGQIMGLKADFTLPAGDTTFHTLSFGIDYKHFDENVTFAGVTTNTPIDYYPVTLAYYGTSDTKNGFTEGGLTASWNHRGTGSEVAKFDNKRYDADGSYLLFKGDISHTHDLPIGFEVMGKLQGQYTPYPLINTEQYAGGGLSSVRGYLEAAAVGDSGWFGTIELRSPSFIGRKKKPTTDAAPSPAAEEEPESEWRVYGFLEGGRLYINRPLPEQVDLLNLSSVGFGTRIRLWDHLNGSLDAAMPLETLGTTEQGEWFVSFRLWTEF